VTGDAKAVRQSGKLYVVATPIGNLADLSPRAVDTLRAAAVIAAEDTRVTRHLLSHAGLKSAELISYREQNERRLAPLLVGRMQEGEDVALVSDAGTPTISDPGYRLVRAAAEAGIEVIAIPGPSAVIALLSIAGLPTERFSFEGFLPAARKARRDAIEALRGAGRTVVLYESPRRVTALLRDLAELLDDPTVAIGRELTKHFEQVLRGTASELAAALETSGVRGEVVVAVHVPQAEVDAPTDQEVRDWIRRVLDEGGTVRDAAERLRARGVARRKVYELARTLG